MKTLTKTALVAISIAALGTVSTAAYAASDPAALPEGDVIYQASYSDEPTLLWTTAADASATVVGTPAPGPEDVTDGAWDPTTGKSYVIGNGYEGPCEIWEANTTTGTFEYIADIITPGDPSNDCDSFDIAPDGTAWITFFNGDFLGKVDLATGAVTDAVEITGDNDGASWIAIQPTTGVVFLGDWDENLFTIDPTTGVVTLVVADESEGYISWYDAAFDSDGLLWITGWPDGTVLFTADVANFSSTLNLQGWITIDGDDDDTGTDSLWIDRGFVPPVSPVTPVVPEPAKPVLAATGLDTAGALGAGAALVLLGFGAFAMARLRRA